MSKKPQEREIPGSAERKNDAACPMSRRERRRAETRERLYAAALRLLSELEFDSVTIEMVTEAADVGKGTFFNYFSNKEAILSYYFETQLRMLTDTLDAAAGGSPAPDWPSDGSQGPREGGPFWRNIIALVHQSAERRHKEKHFTRTLLSLSLTNPQVRAANVEFRGRIIAVICGLIQEAQRSLEFRSDVPADTLAEFMFGTYLGALYMWSQSESGETLHDAIDRAYSRVWSGIRYYDEAPISAPGAAPEADCEAAAGE
jgi:AcrR family transcriptional regulator